MFTQIRYRKPRISKDLLFQCLRNVKSKYLFFQIHSNLLKIDERVDRVLNGRAQFGWTLMESHTTIQFDYWGTLVYEVCNKDHRNKDQPAIIEPDGSRQWCKHGLPHREGDQPAFIGSDGSRFWYKDGKSHREGDQPAAIHSNGIREWYKYGKRHREGDQPAQIWANGTLMWYKHGKVHRDGDKPARIWEDGTREWWKDGHLHREGDKPAIIWWTGAREWYNTCTWKEIPRRRQNRGNLAE